MHIFHLNLQAEKDTSKILQRDLTEAENPDEVKVSGHQSSRRLSGSQ